jgi:hypothetical protein
MSSTNGQVVVTKTMQKIMDLLSDGMPHGYPELFACFEDTEVTKKNVYDQMYFIRKVLRPKGHDIITEFYRRRIYYRHVRLLKNPNKE